MVDAKGRRLGRAASMRAGNGRANPAIVADLDTEATEFVPLPREAESLYRRDPKVDRAHGVELVKRYVLLLGDPFPCRLHDVGREHAESIALRVLVEDERQCRQ